MRKLTIIIALILSSVIMAGNKLTVVIAIDGLTTENLALLRPYWPQGGLRTLSEEAFETEIEIPHLVYGTDETVATLMTGVNPYQHGITMGQFYDRTDRKIHPILEDLSEKGIGTKLQISPRGLLASSITDEIRIRYGTNAKIYAVGIDPSTTILMAGHSANACCWINDDDKRWSTTSFYPNGLPAPADKMNISGRFNEIAMQEWTPRLDISTYMRPTDEEKRKPFNYHSEKVLTKSPTANQLVTELALNIQNEYQMGKDLTPDLLLLQMTTIAPKTKSDQIMSAEQEDMYLSLNQHIGYIIEQLSKRIGAENFKLYVIGIPRLGITSEQYERASMPTGKFNVDRAAALIGAYLMAIYGHERWVDGGYGQSIYLNRSLIEKKHLSIATFQRQVADFLMEFEGVQWAYPIHEAVMLTDVRNSLNKKNSGDVFFTLQPGWQLMYTDETPIDNILQNNVRVPFIFWSGAHSNYPNGALSISDIYQLICE